MTTLVGIVGDPVAHSLSPAMHNAAFKELGLDWHYRAIEVAAASFSEQIELLITEGFVGLNVTIPHKSRAAKFATELSPSAALIGAVNTLDFRVGKRYGENTDALGFIDAVQDSGVDVAGAKVLVLGAGGTARAVLWALARLAVGEIYLWNRTAERARSLAEEFQTSLGISIEQVDTPAAGGSYQLIINTTAVGLGQEWSGSERQLAALRLADQVVIEAKLCLDFVYRQDGPTGLVELAVAACVAVVDGRELLLRQGARSFSLWTDRDAPLEVMRSASIPK